MELDSNNKEEYPGYRFNCSRCEQEFELDIFLSRLVTLGETEVEIALCSNCEKKLGLTTWLPLLLIDPHLLSCH